MTITIIDVSPRDGLQNEPEILAPAVRAELVRRLLAAGVPQVEVGAFVNPKQVPQMAGTAEVVGLVGGLPGVNHRATEGTEGPQGREKKNLGASSASLSLCGSPRTSLTALIPNLRGYELAAAAGLRHVRLVLAASEALNQANFRRSVADSLADFAQIAARAQADGVGFGVAIGASFGCPFEGHVPPERVLALVTRLVALGADEIVLADTTGMAVPTQVRALCEMVRRGEAFAARSHLPNHDSSSANASPLRTADHTDPTLANASPLLTVHLHNTRNTGYANAYAALEAGVTRFDAALGGIGGCPFAPRAVGNIATEDLVHMFNGMGVASGIDLGMLLALSEWLATQLGKPLPALVGKAGMVYAKVRS